MNRFALISLLALASACGDAPSKEKKPIVIVPNNATNNANNANNANNTNQAANNTNNATECCGGRVCGGSPNCENVICGACTDEELCTDTGACEALAEDAPRIIDLSINTTTATPSTLLVISAIVTDPDGIDDLIGGTLKSPTGASYGSFQTSAAEGSYQLNLTWNQLNAVQSIVFEQPLNRELVAEFYDQTGNKVQRSLSITIACESSSEAACSPGVCTDLLTSKEHCGSCNNTLEGPELECNLGSPACYENLTYCPASQQCASEFNPKACNTCNNNCETAAAQLGLNVSQPGSSVSCESEGCSAYVVSNQRLSCDTLCANATCYTSSASFSESGISASCDTNWADAEWDDYGTFISVNCNCIY